MYSVQAPDSDLSLSNSLAAPIATDGLKGSKGVCHGCGASTFLLPLHGARGGPLRCPLCIGKWHAEHGRRRRHGRIVIRALRAYLDNGGSISDIDKLKQSTICSDFLGEDLFGREVTDPLGYLAETANSKGETIELTSELLADAITLAHPDHHPPERQELARRTTQGLLALKPFVFPAPKPKKLELAPRRAAPTKTQVSRAHREAYPCADCRDAVPADYCSACRAEYDKRRQQEFDRRTAKQRAQYAERRKRLLMRRSPQLCASCSKEFQSRRADARFCSPACRQRMHRRAPITDKSKTKTVISFKRDILAMLDRHRAVFLNDLLPPNRTNAQYQALCRASRQLEDAGEIESLRYLVQWGKPGFLVLVKPGHKVEHPDAIPRLKPDERLVSEIAEVRS
jgi:hypothetical protein